MSRLAAVQGKILAGKVVGLQEDIRNLVGASSSGGEGQQIIRACSRFVYENEGLDEQCFCTVLEIVRICCEHHHQHIIGDPFFHMRSLYYILHRAIQKKEFHHHLIRLVSSIEPYLELCDTSKEEVLSMVKRMYPMVWNASLNTVSPLVALTLQRLAFQCALAFKSNLGEVCRQAVAVHIVYEKAEKSAENSEQYFQAVLKYLTQTLSKQSACDENSVVAIVGLVMEYAKVAMQVGKFSDFGRNNKQIVKILEAHCDSKMVTSLKAGLKLPEMAIALQLGKCAEEMLRKLLGSCGVVVAALPGPNTVLILGLLTTMTLLQQPTCSNLKLTSHIFEILMKRCRIPVPDDIVKKICYVLDQQLINAFDVINGSSEVEPETLLSHVLAWADPIKSFSRSHLYGKPDKMDTLYSFGVHFSNFGYMASRSTKYDTAAKLLELTVDFFSHYYTHSSPEQKQNVCQNLTKRLQLWSDVLRYGGHHWEAGVAAARGFLTGLLSVEELVTMWVKCQRDAKKNSSKLLKNMTVCDVVTEARRKYKEGDGVVFDQDAALLKEIQCYKQQKYNTVEEQLSCGRAAAKDGRGVETQVRGLLAVAEALWTYPDMGTEEQEATDAAQQAKNLLQEAKICGSKKPILLELEALVHFWEYLCYIQAMYAKADAEVKEAKKPNPFTVQVPEPGEEEQVHDRCDGRPTALLSLHTQHTSLVPLQAALDIWDKFVTEDLPLEDPVVTCASLTSVGYVYHLSGLAAPTIQAWGLLISLARRHSLQNYLIKGVVELILTAPEVVDTGLVSELEQIVSSDIPANSQETSQVCLHLSASVATAFLYYKTGQYKAGVKLIHKALQSEVLAKRTIKTTEVETLVHLVASLYAWLPPWLLQPAPALPAPCFSLALLACRQANALVMMALTDTNSDIICWRHRVASLLFTTTAWLGHLSITIAQPRTARAYIEKSLQFSQQLILPLRIAEFLELLARVDVLCDQLVDCRVKVDSLEALLKTHPSPQEELQELVPEFTQLTISKTSKIRKKKAPEIFCDPVGSDGERMRTDSGMQDLHLKRCLPVPFQLESTGVVSSSPSEAHRENVAIVRFSCPIGGVQCVLCATPIIHQLRISTAVLLALLHAHSERFQAAQKCLDQAQKMYDDVAEKAHEVSSFMVSFLRREVKDMVISPAMFVNSRLNLVHLQLFHAQAECLALEGKWDKALSVNLECLQALASQETQLLIQDMHFAAVLCLQGQALENIISRNWKSPEDVVTTEQTDDEMSVTVTTPKMSSKKMDGSCTKTTNNLLNAPKHVNRRNLIFSIHSDEEEEDSTEPTTKPATAVTPHKLISQAPNKFFKSKSAQKKPPSSARKKENAENKNVLDSLEADWGDSLSHLVLNVPSDLPLSPLNSVSHFPSHPDGERLGLPTSPKTTSKTRNKAGQRARASKSAGSKGRSATSISKSCEDVKAQGDIAPSQSRTRAARAASSSTSKAKVVTEPKPTTRTRASRSLRLI